MPTCHEMKLSEIYACQSCGFEMEVKQACTCEPDCDSCPPQEFSCCEQPLVKKER